MSAEFFRVWLTFSLMVIGGAVAAAIWAARAGHFRDQERARSLALWAEVEEDERQPHATPQQTQSKPEQRPGQK